MNKLEGLSCKENRQGIAENGFSKEGILAANNQNFSVLHMWPVLMHYYESQFHSYMMCIENYKKEKIATIGSSYDFWRIDTSVDLKFQFHRPHFSALLRPL